MNTGFCYSRLDAELSTRRLNWGLLSSFHDLCDLVHPEERCHMYDEGRAVFWRLARRELGMRLDLDDQLEVRKILWRPEYACELSDAVDRIALRLGRKYHLRQRELSMLAAAFRFLVEREALAIRELG